MLSTLAQKAATRVTKLKKLSRHPRCRFLGQNWKHDLARSCFILETAFHVSTENGKEQLRSAPWTMCIAKSALSAKTTWHTWRWTKGLINQPRYSHIFSIWFMTITFLFEIINALFSTLLMLCLNLFICECCKIKFLPGVPFSFCTYGTDTQTGKTG